MLFSTALRQLFSLIMIIAVGVLLTKLNIIKKEMLTGMGNIMTKACLPCLLITNMQVEFNKEIIAEMGTAAAGFMTVMLLSALLILPVALLKKADIKETGALIVCASFPNVVYMGTPLIEAVYGVDAKASTTIITLVFTVTVFSVGILIISLGNRSKTKGIKRILLDSFINPSVIAGILGIALFLFSVKLPSLLLSPLKMLSSMITPLSMLIIGSTLTQANIKEILTDWRVYAISFVRLIAAPVIIFLLLSLFIQNKAVLGTLTIGASLPVGANAGVIAQLYDNNPILAAKSIFMSTVLCVITTPLIVLLLLSN